MREHYKIIFNKTNNIICSGTRLDIEKNVAGNGNDNFIVLDKPLITFDGKIFWNWLSKNITIKLDLDKRNIPLQNKDCLTAEPWTNYGECYTEKRLDTIDCFIERDYDEIDKELTSLCDTLNDIEGIETVCSCCGHNIKQPYISINFSNINSLKFLINILDEFNNKIIITSNIKEKQNRNSIGIVLILTTPGLVGQDAYKYIDLLADKLKEIKGDCNEHKYL